MYSVVMMMALSGSAQAPDHGCMGCYDCGCNVCGCNVCHGCQGCHHGLFGGLFHGCHGCQGCWGSHGCCSYNACCGCNYNACCGCNYNACCGCNYNACCGCNSCHGCHGCFHGLFSFFHHHGCCGCNACQGCCGYNACCGCSSYGCCGCASYGCCGCDCAAPAAGAPVAAPPVEAGPRPKDLPPAEKKAQSNAPATIVVTLPAEARLTVDGYVTRSTSAERTFISPALETGADYTYTLQAEITREGRSVVETQRVSVRAGETTRAAFNFSEQGVASR